MSLFVQPQSLPFQTVIRFLQIAEPGSALPPADWARQHAGRLNVGDIIFTFEPIYSPWGDSSTGIGIADGDSFKINQMVIVFKKEADDLVAFVIAPDMYQMQTASAFLSKQVEQSRGLSQGFYYVVARPPAHIVAERTAELAKLERYGNTGWRSDEAQTMDVCYAFFQSFGLPVESAPGQNLDFQSMAFLWIVDREPPSGMRVVDLRGRFGPLTPFDASKSSSNEIVPMQAEDGAASFTTPQIPPSIKAPLRRIIPAKPSTGSAAGAAKNIPIGTPVPKPSAPGRPVPPKPVRPGQRTSGAQAEEVAALAASANEAALETAATNSAEVTDVASPEPAAVSGGVDNPTSDLEISIQQSLAHDEMDSGAAEPALTAVPQSPPQPAVASLEAEAPAAPPLPQPEPVAPSTSERPVFPRYEKEMETTLDIPSPGPIIDEPAEELIIEEPETPIVVEDEAVADPDAQEDRGLAEIEETIASLAAATDGSAKTPKLGNAAKMPPMPSGPSPAASAVTSKTSSGPIPGRKDELVPPAPSHSAQEANVPNRPYMEKETLTPASAADLAAQLTAVARGGESDLPPVMPAETLKDVVEPVGESEKSPVISPPPKKKRAEHEGRAQELQNRHVKDQVAVKSGVAGLVSKLEQQASKASAKLETQVEEQQSALALDQERLLDSVSASEKRGVKTIEGVRLSLSAKLEAASAQVREKVRDSSRSGCEVISEQVNSGKSGIDEKFDALKTGLDKAFAGVRSAAETLARSFNENSEAEADKTADQLKELIEKIQSDFEEQSRSYEKQLQSSFDHFKERLSTHTSMITDGLQLQYRELDAEMDDLQQRCREQISHAEQKLNASLAHVVLECELGIVRMQSTALTDTIIPRLKEYRQKLRALTIEFQTQITDDLENKGQSKINQIEPMTVEKKQQLNELLEETTQIKETIQERQRKEFEQISTSLAAYIEENVEEAKALFRATEERISEIDKAVRVLADPSSIESDLELLDERNNVLVRMDDSTEKATDEVTNTLRTKVAALEERGKQLQEELISGMEEDAYLVRRSSEQALNRTREAIKDAFASIQSAQDAHME